jgi:DNA-binding transcriptional ArsR family regulator
MSPQDILVLLKITCSGDKSWNQKSLSESLDMSQSEISKSLARSKYAGLLDVTGKKVFKSSLLEFIQYGLKYVFPQQLGPIVRGVPTSHSASPLNKIIQSTEHYVWPFGKGSVKGQSVIPLYPSIPKIIQTDENLYELLALIDAIRIGKAREREIAIEELKFRLLDGK